MNTTRTLEQIEAEIAKTEAELKNLHGTETEVYARIVGYYRAVRNWNKGKRDEFNNRTLFVYDGDISDSRAKNTEHSMTNDFSEEKQNEQNINTMDNSIHYEFFMRQTCPNCPPVKKYISDVSFEGKFIDVDTDEGLKEAASKGVFSAPTVIFYDQTNTEIGRGHNVEELKGVLEPQAILA